MKKHAFLIIAHNQFDLLKLQLKKLDHNNIDFFILIDKKSLFSKADFLNVVSKSNIYWIKRINISWGDYSLVAAMLLLLKEAVKNEYDYYHFVSGVDLPIKPVNEIIDFFEKNSKEYIEVTEFDDSIKSRYQYYYFLQKYATFPIANFFNKLLVKFQKVLKVNRIDKKIAYAKGSNWASITNNFAIYILQNENDIKKLFKFGFCIDELFLQTMLVNSPFLKNHENNNLRLIIWDEKHVKSPRVLTKDDKEIIKNSTCLFARKFSTIESAELIKELEIMECD